MTTMHVTGSRTGGNQDVAVGEGAVISDAQAKTIARLWATENPQLQLFLRSGLIAYELIESLASDARMLEAAVRYEDAPPVVARAQLRALVRYVRAHGPRGPQPGWSRIGHTDPLRGIVEPIVAENFQRARQRRVAHGAGTGAPAAAFPRAGDRGASSAGTIYDRLGAPAIAEIVTIYFTMVMGDPALARYFDGRDVNHVMGHMHAFLCVATGGPLGYVGRSLRGAHAALGITDQHFDRMVEHMRAALAGVGAAVDIHAAIISKIEAFRSHVVTR